MKISIYLSVLTAVGCLTVANTNAHAADKPAGVPDNYQLLYQQDFNGASALKDFVFTDPAAWKLAHDEKTAALELAKQSQYKPPHRSPVNIALIADKVFGDFVLDVSLKQTGRDYGHRDMCLFFEVQDPAHFYYVHMATAADPHAHNVFIVNAADRIKFATKTTKGIDWGHDVWHHVRLTRNTADGAIKVYFDDMNTPIMEATDKHFISGYIGFGSFDDTGMVDNIRIWGPSVKTKPTSFFKHPSK